MSGWGDSRLPPRFWDKTTPEPNSGCWLWTAYTRPDGYGSFRVDRQMRLAHRVAYTSLVAPIPEGLELDHLCRNRGCCNPAHLEAVTHEVNLQRGNVGQAQRARTHCPKEHLYSEANTRTVAGKRKCRACGRADDAARYQRGKVNTHV